MEAVLLLTAFFCEGVKLQDMVGIQITIYEIL